MSRAVPRQERSQQKVDAILLAAREIMADDGLELTVREIELRVDFSVGTIYRYFESLEAIVDAVLTEHAEAMEAHMASVLDRTPTGSLDALFSALVDAVIAFYQANPKLTQSQVAGEYRVRYAAIEEASNGRLVATVAALAAEHELIESSSSAATRLLVHWSAVGAALRIAFSHGPDGDPVALAEARRMAESFAASYLG